nr:uncharacterized protein LOC104098476 [Nicotiana tomentosiformis]
MQNIELSKNHLNFEDIMLPEMGFQGRYVRLGEVEDLKVASRPRRCWLIKKMNGRLKGIKLSRSRKLNWKAFSMVILPRRIARIYGEIVKRMKNMEDVCPAIVFSCHWGFPVLSHSTVKSRRNTF